jgi:hypothetical protein
MALGMWIIERKKRLAALTYLVGEGALSQFSNGRRWPREQIHRLRQQMSEELIHKYGARAIADHPSHPGWDSVPKGGKQLPNLGWHYDSRLDGCRGGESLERLGRVGNAVVCAGSASAMSRARGSAMAGVAQSGKGVSRGLAQY